MKIIKKSLMLFFSVFLLHTSHAQDSISVKDAGDIRFKSEKIIAELNQLLGMLSTSDIEDKEKIELMTGSYTPSSNMIFKDSSVLVEDDTNPLFKTSSQSKDETIPNYLHDFDLFYKKGDEPSVELKNVQSSKVKKKDNLYVKVYFNSHFKSTYSVNESPYEITNRVAEVRVTKDNNKWIVRIARIGFFNPSDTVNDILNNIPLIYSVSTRILKTGQDSAQAIAEEQSIEDQLAQENRRKDAAEEQIKQEKINAFLSKSEKAREQNDFTSAYLYLNQAKELAPVNVIVLGAISKTQRLEQASKFTSDQVYDHLIKKAKLEEANRQYEYALRDYKSAFALKPDEEPKYTDHIKVLTVKFRTLAELNEKYDAGQYKEAVKDFDKAIKKDNKNSDYYLGRGKCYDKMGEYPKALKNYVQAYDLDNNNLGALRCSADLNERTDQPFKAITDYKTYLTIYKEDMEIYEKISDLHFKLNQTNEAITDLDAAIEVNQKASHIYYKKGLLLYIKEDYKGAAENFTNSIKIDSTYALAYYNRGKTMLNLNNISRAAADFANARRKGLDDADLQSIRDYANEFYNRSNTRYSSNNIDSAIILVDYAIMFDPNSSTYWFSRGEYCFAQANYDVAIKCYDNAIQNKSDYNEAFYKRGISYYYLSNYKVGIENFNSLLKLNGLDIMGYKGKGDCYFSLNDYSNAAEAYENCIRLINNTKNFNIVTEGEIYNSAGKCYFQLNNYDKALASFKNAIKYNKTFTEAYFNRGYTYYKLNSLGDAIDDINKALQTEKHYQWLYVQGKVYQEKKNYSDAVNSYSSCVTIDTAIKIPDAIYSNGYCLYQSQQFAEALKFYNRSIALKLDESIPTFYNELGNIYLNTLTYDSAYSCFQKSLNKNGGDGFASYGIACVYLGRGKKDESIDWFEKSFKTQAYKYNEIKKDRLLNPIRDDKRFKDLIKKYY